MVKGVWPEGLERGMVWCQYPWQPQWRTEPGKALNQDWREERWLGILIELEAVGEQQG